MELNRSSEALTSFNQAIATDRSFYQAFDGKYRCLKQLGK